MTSDGQILWNAVAICEMSKTSKQTGQLRMNEDVENLSKDQLFHLVHWWNTSQIPRETQLEFINSEKKVSPGILLGHALIAGGIGKGDILIADNEGLEKFDGSEIYSRRPNTKEVLINHKDGEFCISCG